MEQIQTEKAMKKLLVSLPIFVFLIALSAFYILKTEERIGPPIKSIEMAVYQLPASISTEQSTLLTNQFADEKGITAITVSDKSKLAAITYYPDVVNKIVIQSKISELLKESVTEHEYPKSNKVCPVHEPMAYIKSLF